MSGFAKNQLINNWLHIKGRNKLVENPYFVASRLCGTACCRRKNIGIEEVDYVIDMLINMGLLEDLGGKLQDDEYDFNTMRDNSEKIGKFLRKCYDDEETYLKFLIETRDKLENLKQIQSAKNS